MTPSEINIYLLNKYTNEDFFPKCLLPFSDSGGPLLVALSPGMCEPQSTCLWVPGHPRKAGWDQNGGRQEPRTARSETEALEFKVIDMLIARQV